MNPAADLARPGLNRAEKFVRARGAWFACLVLLWTSSLCAVDSATVSFSLDFPGSDPEHYSITVDTSGRAKYECSGKISTDSDDTQSYQAEFTFSEATRAHIFDLAAQAHYFSGKIDSGNKRLAFTGSKKLVYTDGQHNAAASYNFSQVPAVQQLTTLFQNVGATMEFGRRLDYFHRYQKLALDDELKRMELEARTGDLSELQAVEPILKQIYDDGSVINIVRARAERIMAMGKAAPTPR